MNKTVLRIRLFPDPLLRKKTKQVNQITDAHRNILSEMSRLMYDSKGVGLAGSQVGISESMIVVDIGLGLYKLINPKIIKKEGRQVIEEGCLSIPEVCIKIKRAKKIKVEACDEFGKSITIDAQDLLACAFQHEIDHLKGRLIIDYASFFEKMKIRRKLEELKKRLKDERLFESQNKSCKLQL